MKTQDNNLSENAYDGLLFQLSDLYYAVDAHKVRQILWLPEITILDNSPFYQPGMFILRGERVSVIDLNLRFGHPAELCTSSDCIIVIETQNGLIGLIANYASDVVVLEKLPEQDNRTSLEKYKAGSIIVNQALYDNEVVMILDENRLLDNEDIVIDNLTPRTLWGEHLSDSDLKLLKQRMLSYRQQDQEASEIELLGLVVVSLGGEHFGILLSEIKEFADKIDISLIPCCPAHVLGNMNLRGDILTVIDISQILGVDINQVSDLIKVIVYQHYELLLGVAVEKILDVIFIKPSELKPVPAALKMVDYVLGEIVYKENIITLLDFNMIANRKELVVEESV
ncbi:MAG: chemotaxis protein CheW [Gammaproteobacteria bacterium]|nr:chemotaxis protein CheW [Gammaproteobacteria bacterium]